jgi:TPR repeat protein
LEILRCNAFPAKVGINRGETAAVNIRGGRSMGQRIKIILAGGLPALAPYREAVADTLIDGMTAYQGGDYKTAFRLLQPPGDQGNVDAFYSLGTIYEDGHGVPQDYSQAIRWFRKAANQA